MIYGIDKILQLSHPKFHQKNMKNMITALTNDYPLLFIFHAIHIRLKYFCNNTTAQKVGKNERNRYSTISYIKFSEAFSHISRRINLEPVFV